MTHVILVSVMFCHSKQVVVVVSLKHFDHDWIVGIRQIREKAHIFQRVTVSIRVSLRKISNDGSDCVDSKIPAQMYGPAATIPSLITPVPDTWTIETGEFLMVHAVSQTHISSDCFFAPSSSLNDGVIWLCIIRGGASRKELLKFFLGMSTGTHLPNVPSEYIKMIPVMAFRIEPIVDSTEEKYGHLTVDGEKVEYGPVQGEVFPSIAKVMVPNFSL